MTALTERKQQLPETIEELAKFVLIGREKLNAVRSAIRAIEKVGLAKEVHEQKLAEAQEIAEAVLDAEVKLGELTAKMETAAGTRSDLKPKDTAVPKSAQLEKIGITEKQKQRYEKLAKHPKAVESAKEIAREEGRVVSRQDVLDLIIEPSEPKRPSPQEFIRQTEKQHEDFLERKKKGVVSIEDARADKEREGLIAIQTWLKISKALKSIGDLAVTLNMKNVDLMIRVKEADEVQALMDDITMQIKCLEGIKRYMEERI